MKPKTFLILMTMMLFCLGLVEAWAQQDVPFVYKDRGKRDPFWPLVNAGGAIVNYADEDLLLTDLNLEGIMTGEAGENIAIINGTIVKENDKVGLYVIKTIEPYAVVLLKGDETFTLKLKKEE